LRKSKKSLCWFNYGVVESVAREVCVEPSEVREMESRLASQDATFEAPIDDEDGGSAYTAPVYYLEDKAS
ncbi:RNA polymerase factor sigma-32, partial [Vibrio echinoideorum]